MVFHIGGRRNSKLGKNGATVPTTSYLNLVKQRKFDKISSMLQNETINHTVWLNQKCNDELSSELPIKSQPPLHILLAYQPDAQVVKLLIKKLIEISPNQDPLQYKDVLGRTPLHVAAGKGCNVSVLKCLIITSLTLDDWNRTPLHWAVVASTTATKAGNGGRYSLLTRQSRRQSMIDDDMRINQLSIVYTLTKVYPGAVMIRDEQGCTPLDLAIRNGIDVNNPIYCILNKAAKTYKETEVQFGKFGRKVLDAINAVDLKEEDETESSSSCRSAPIEEVSITTDIYNDGDDCTDISSIGSNDVVMMIRSPVEQRLIPTIDACFR